MKHLLLTVLLGCAAPQQPSALQATGEPDAAVAVPQEPVVTAKEDRCADFNRSRSTLSDAEHQERYGCPPCPCACNDGQIVCAPCAACDPRQAPVPEPTATQSKDVFGD